MPFLVGGSKEATDNGECLLLFGRAAVGKVTTAYLSRKRDASAVEYRLSKVSRKKLRLADSPETQF